jgi:hypothetical protein
MRRILRLLLVGLLLSVGPAYLQAQPLTGQHILEKVDARGGLGGVGSQISFTTFTIVDKTGTQQDKYFVFFGKNSTDPQIPNRVMIYFLAPPLETCGTIFLSIDKKIPGQKSDLYLYLPALGQVKQLISTGERKGSFAGSNIQFDQIGRSQLSTDFEAELISEETIGGLTVNGQKQDRSTYVLHLTANPANNPDDSFPERRLWVDQQEFMVLKSENTNTIGKLQDVMTLDNLVTFKDRLEPNTIMVKNVLENSSTTVTITDREDVGELPDGIFDPAGLSQFDPRQFNDKLQVKVPDPVCP